MRLSVEETLRNLKQVEEKYKIRFTPTGEVNISEMARDCIDTIESLQQENEQLRAQVARMRETLIECVNALELCAHDELCKIAVSPYDMIQDAKKALAEIDKAIGGKEE